MQLPALLQTLHVSVGSKARLHRWAVIQRFLEQRGICSTFCPAWVGVDHAVCVQPVSVSPGRAGRPLGGAARDSSWQQALLLQWEQDS